MSHATKDSQNCNLRRKIGKLLEFHMKERKAVVSTVEPRQLFFAFPGVSNRSSVLEEHNLVALPVVGLLSSSKALATPW